MVIQSIDSIVTSVKIIKIYSAGLIATVKRKSCVEMGKQLSVSHDMLNRALGPKEDAIRAISEILKSIIREWCALFEPGWLIIDDTLVAKAFANLIPGLDFHKDSSSGNYTKGLCVVVIAWTNGKITIPLGFRYWFSKKLMPEGYKTKIQLAQELIASYHQSVDSIGILMDGLYASKEMMDFLNNRGINFVMRMASNRVVTLVNGNRVKIRNLNTLRPQRNARSRTQRLLWRGLNLFITSEIRINRHGERSTVFLVSNYEADSKYHVERYRWRWSIEMFFRTAKQSLGLEECSARSLEKQTVHIYHVFLSYAYLECERVAKDYDNVESVVKSLQAAKSPKQKRLIGRLGQFFNAYA